MFDAADIEPALRDTGESLRQYWEATEHDTLEELDEEHEDEIRDAYAAIQASVPDDSTCAIGLTVLALGKLRAHLNGESGGVEDPFDAPWHPPAGLDADDELGRELAAEVVRAARRTLELQPADNLAAFSLACALHWLGDDAAAAAAYGVALRLDPQDDVARARVEAPEAVTPSGPSPTASSYPYGFHLLEMTHVVGHSGSRRGRVWLLNDAAAVRAAADDHLDAWLANRAQSLSEDFGVWTHLPDAPGAGSELAPVLQEGAGGRQTIDWSKATLPSLGADRLPPGRPIRWHGQLHFFGCTELDD
ncbi:hypothetical protein [Amycolatopsis viridis]|uniref:Tetratricopeptide repeat protein n=1 Tax=Amycolatopsis viridis TaxID=185678 RepID=A0ABX0SX49_9PSEU|nr:hypothetical protein [Amycolatopsis viridis]NIH81522.1 hypothetical protein [Amycolatopsis viridis]